MKKLWLTALVGASIAFTAGVPVGAYDLKDLRGAAIDAADKPFEQKKQVTTDGGFARSWKEAPPQIPHKIEKDRITLQDNSCMRCHSEANYKTEKAPRIGDSHYVDAQGKKLETMNMRRWFCDQCHVPQADVEPLVENVFAGKPYKK